MPRVDAVSMNQIYLVKNKFITDSICCINKVISHLQYLVHISQSWDQQINPIDLSLYTLK